MAKVEETLNVKKVSLTEDENSLVRENPRSEVKPKKEASEIMNVDYPKEEI